MSAHDYLFNLAVQQFAQQFYAANLLLAQNPEQLYQHQDVLPSLQNPLQLPRELYSVPAQAIPVAAVQPPPVEEAPATAPQPVRLFRGEVEHHKKTSREDTLIYRCSGCRHQNEKFTSVHVTGDVFHTDPCLLPHNCAPLDRYGDKADRVTYQLGKFAIQGYGDRRRAFVRAECHGGQKIRNAMEVFRNEWTARSYIATVTINEYCRTMSRYVTEKTV
ncbi:hypothetical protein Y032_0255g313 [Ancylostoma ceylanicum]|uniref:Uncharacterized protein n=1 Tax=Ancylostoma ceylanicum TaxID=53326 RepID=A0A016SBZ9_9BILA|nr:hypothetical protein Y032_0255g313 [Ancylostoma ceylanicum]